MSLYNKSHDRMEKNDCENAVTPKEIVELPQTNDSDIKLFYRFIHECPPPVVDVQKAEPTKESELKYRDEIGALFSARPDNDTIHQGLKLIEGKAPKTFVFPEKILVGQDFYNSRSGVYANVLDDGNIWIDVQDGDEDNPAIDNFIVSYIFKIVEKFPLGRVRFYILDEKSHWCYEMLKQNLNHDGANAFCKSAVELIVENSTSFLEKIKKTLCPVISQKMGAQINNIKDLCIIDPSECVSFVIIRDSLDKISSHWNLLETLMIPGESAHKCGFRFLVVHKDAADDKYSSFEKLNKILDHCEIQYRIAPDSFLLADDFIEPLSVDVSGIELKGNTKDHDAFTIEGALRWSSALSKLSSSILEHNELWEESNQFKDATKSARISIPVGKCGGDIFSLPFSSANDDNSAEGAVVNYLVAGSTGSGKSSLMHSIIINGAITYSPEDLRFWIIDFKNGQESNKYRNANIPHIELLSSENTKDDARYIFSMLHDEIKRRTALFKNYDGDITKYNKAMDEQKKPHVPRIIVIVDEVQELCANNDGDTDDWDPADRIGRLADRCRFAGIHIVLIAQNLAANGYQLSSKYLPSAHGNVAFSMDLTAFSETFSTPVLKDVSSEINKLQVGTSYVRLHDKRAKVRFAFTHDLSKYFETIRNKCAAHEHHDRFNGIKTKVIGEVSKLLLDTRITEFWNNGNGSNYHTIISNLSESNTNLNTQTAIIGENSYSLDPLNIDFSSGKQSSTLILGSSKKIGTSIIKSIVKSLRKAENTLYVFNLDKSTDYEAPHQLESGDNPLTCYCNTYSQIDSTLWLESQSQFGNRFEYIYREYLNRKERDQQSNKKEYFTPIYLFINHISKLNDYFSQQALFDYQPQSVPQHPTNEAESYAVFNDAPTNDGEGPYDTDELSNDLENSLREPISQIRAGLALFELMEHGYQYSIHIIASMFDSVSIDDFSSKFKRVILFNDARGEDLPTSMAAKYTLNNMLKSIRSTDEDETRALLVTKDSITKLRPIIYEISEYEIKEENLK